MKERRILVIARRESHKLWEQRFYNEEAHIVVPYTNLYGSRFDLIIVDVPLSDSTDMRFYDWIDNGVRCRLSPKWGMFLSQWSGA